MKYTKFDTLDTPYAEKLERNAPWSDYPRPQLVRDSYLSLNGEWDFGTSKSADNPVFSNKILVPFPPESKLSGLETEICADDFMHYKRTFILPESFVCDRVILHFGAVDTLCRVYLNGVEVIKHEGGYLPFSVDITETASVGENTLYVCVSDELNHVYPYGKQRRDRGGMWYTPVSGIWQSVWIESVCENYIKAIKMTPTLHSDDSNTPPR